MPHGFFREFVDINAYFDVRHYCGPISSTSRVAVELAPVDAKAHVGVVPAAFISTVYVVVLVVPGESIHVKFAAPTPVTPTATSVTDARGFIDRFVTPVFEMFKSHSALIAPDAVADPETVIFIRDALVLGVIWAFSPDDTYDVTDVEDDAFTIEKELEYTTPPFIEVRITPSPDTFNDGENMFTVFCELAESSAPAGRTNRPSESTGCGPDILKDE